MGITKTDIYSNEDLDIAALAKSLAHPARIAILRYLAKSNTCITGDLSNVVGLAQPTISQHLKELKAVGLIQGTISGTAMKYCIHQERWTEVQREFEQLFNEYSKTNKCC